MVVEATVDFPNCFHHFLKLSHLRNVALDPLDFGDRHQIYVYRLLQFHFIEKTNEKKTERERKWKRKQKQKSINVRNKGRLFICENCFFVFLWNVIFEDLL